MEKKGILKFVSSISVTTKNFIAKKCSVVSIKDKDLINVHLSDVFINWFPKYAGNTKSQIEEVTLHCEKLLRTSRDGPIIATLDGEEKARITLREMFSIMEKQKNGEDGILLNNGSGNIFYIKDKNDILRAVVVRWDDGDGIWNIGAYYIEHPTGWCDGSYVFHKELKEGV